jgi:AcrR family transcriptional regulator
MPALPKTSDDAIVEAARRLIEDAREEFSMAAVAAAVGVRTPSLYKRFADRDALLARVRHDAIAALHAAIVAAAPRSSGTARLRAMAKAYRTFALARPRLYALLFLPDDRVDEHLDRARAAAVAPVLELLAPIAGSDRALDAARTFTAFVHGHVMMILAGSFHLGGDVDAAFDYGIDRLLAGIAAKR